MAPGVQTLAFPAVTTALRDADLRRADTRMSKAAASRCSEHTAKDRPCADLARAFFRAL